MLFSHGFGCDQLMWRFVAPRFEDEFRVVVFDHLGAGDSDLSAYEPDRHSSLQGYADDVLAICHELELDDVIFVGHSVSAMIGVLAAAVEPERFSQLVLVCPSPCYINDGSYVGGSESMTSRICSSRSRATTWAGRAVVSSGPADRGSAPILKCGASPPARQVCRRRGTRDATRV
jgi:pimeloyl-ACP methyl ester carboxylesterase